MKIRCRSSWPSGPAATSGSNERSEWGTLARARRAKQQRAVTAHLLALRPSSMRCSASCAASRRRVERFRRRHSDRKFGWSGVRSAPQHRLFTGTNTCLWATDPKGREWLACKLALDKWSTYMRRRLKCCAGQDKWSGRFAQASRAAQQKDKSAKATCTRIYKQIGVMTSQEWVVALAVALAVLA